MRDLSSKSMWLRCSSGVDGAIAQSDTWRRQVPPQDCSIARLGSKYFRIYMVAVKNFLEGLAFNTADLGGPGYVSHRLF